MDRKGARKVRFLLWIILAHLRISTDITGDCLAPPLSRVKQVRVTFLASFSFFGYSFRFEQVIIWKKTDYREKKKNKTFYFYFLHCQTLPFSVKNSWSTDVLSCHLT